MKRQPVRREIIICLVILVFLQMLTGCSGCSQSGIRERAKRNASQSTEAVPAEQEPAQESYNNKESTSTPLPLNELFRMYQPAVFMVLASDGDKEYQGTGFFISNDGIAVSNYHVFKETKEESQLIKTATGQVLNVEKILHKNSTDDYIIFQVAITEETHFIPIPVGKGLPEIGEDVFAIGNPYGLENTLSKGIVSGYRDDKRLIQTTAEITHGSSGGPLLNMNGEVIGITTSGIGEANINFAVNFQIISPDRYR